MCVNCDDVVSFVRDVVSAFPNWFENVVPKAKKYRFEFDVGFVFCVVSYDRNP